MNYSTDTDLVALRPDILSLGVEKWTPQHDESKRVIDRVLEFKWYRNAAEDNGVNWRDAPFNPDNIDNPAEQLKRLSSYKALELCYEYLMQAAPEPTAFSALRDLFAKKYKEELSDVLGAGIDYDWTESGAISAEETAVPTIRRLKRM